MGIAESILVLLAIVLAAAGILYAAIMRRGAAALKKQLAQRAQSVSLSNTRCAELEQRLREAEIRINEAEHRLSDNHRQLKANELELLESELKFKELVELLPQVVFEADQHGRFTFTNQRGFELTGYSQKDIEQGLNVLDSLVPEDRARAHESMVEIFHGRRLRGNEYTFLRKDGSTFPGVIYSSPILIDGKPAGLRGIVVDITDQRIMEEERQRAQKLESIGTLAGGIAHDFNNLLGAVFGGIDLALHTLPNDSPARSYLLDTLEAHAHARNLTQQLLTFAKGGMPNKKVISLKKVIGDAVSLALSGSNARCETDIEQDLWLCSADEGQILQVLNNLLINAQQAMPAGGKILLRALNVTIAQEPALPLADGRYVRIDVIDEGRGIDPAHIERIFDPFFTTKSDGSGLGLATSYSIIKKHSGCIHATSNPGISTTFTFWLPAAHTNVDTAQPDQQAPRRGKGRILILDDERAIRKMAKAMLTQLGYEAQTAETADEAIEDYRREMKSRGYDAVILDLTIPGGKGGEAVLDQLRKMEPSVKAIVSSGYSDDPVMADPAAHGFVGMIKKPYLLKDLARALEMALATGGSSPRQS
jgi:PAS domain S-box-containing protein